MLGWTAPRLRSDGHFQKTFSSAAEATEGVLDAFSAVYGIVGDEKGWYVLAVVQHGDAPWVGGKWSGDESQVAWLAAESRSPGRPLAALFGAAVGFGCAWVVLQSLVFQGGWTVDPIPMIGIVVGCGFLAMMVSQSRIPEAVVRAGAYMWGDGILVWAISAAALASIPALVWGVGLVLLFGSPRAGQ